MGAEFLEFAVLSGDAAGAGHVLAHTQMVRSAGGPHHLCMGEDVACSGGIAGKNGKFQEFCAHYTEDSTPEDPIVRISGVANSGPFDLIRHINDIDPANAASSA